MLSLRSFMLVAGEGGAEELLSDCRNALPTLGLLCYTRGLKNENRDRTSRLSPAPAAFRSGEDFFWDPTRSAPAAPSLRCLSQDLNSSAEAASKMWSFFLPFGRRISKQYCQPERERERGSIGESRTSLARSPRTPPSKAPASQIRTPFKEIL